MSEYNAFPLSWPIGWKRHTFRVESRFGSRGNPPTVSKATTLVLGELRRMGVFDYQVVISTNVQLRLDGLPYSNTRTPTDPGVAVYFKVKEKKKVLACDKYSTVGENLYAIGKTIEATRAIERWGSVTTEQAFAGYVQLNESTQESCWVTLGIPPSSSEEEIMGAYRQRAFETHPDRNPGQTSERFEKVVKAKDIALQLIKR